MGKKNHICVWTSSSAWGFFLPIIIFYVCKGESQLSATSCTSCFKAATLNIRNTYFPLPGILQNLFQMWSWNTGCIELCISVCTNIRHYRTGVHVELQPTMTLFSRVRGYLVLPMPSPLLFQDSRYYIKYDAKSASFQNSDVDNFPALRFWNMLCLCSVLSVYFCWFWQTLLQGNMQYFSYFSMSLFSKSATAVD